MNLMTFVGMLAIEFDGATLQKNGTILVELNTGNHVYIGACDDSGGDEVANWQFHIDGSVQLLIGDKMVDFDDWVVQFRKEM